MKPAEHGASWRGNENCLEPTQWNLKEPQQYSSYWKDHLQKSLSELWNSTIRSYFMYSGSESLYCTPETNITLDVNWNLNKTSLKKEAIVHL